MYEVNFGEAIIYHENEKKLLVDCGAKFSSKGKLAFERVSSEVEKNTKLLITHFDEDHYNGIIQMPDTQKFEKIYLPLYFYRDKNVYLTEMYVDAIKIWTYLIAVGMHKRISALHRLFLKLPQLVKSICDIRCIGEGDTFTFAQKNVNVIWPCGKRRKARKLYAEEILTIIRGCTTNVNNRQTVEEFVALADEYVDAFLGVYRLYCEDKQEYVVTRTEEIINRFNKLFEVKVNVELDELAKKRINSITSTIIKNMNECSIVFEIGCEVIAFGDVSPRIIRLMKKDKMISHNTYKVVKVQHHGTKAYWSDLLPDASVYLISNSGKEKVNWSIDKRYGLKYTDRVMCTNWNSERCNYIAELKMCKWCKTRQREKAIVVDCSCIMR